MRAVTDLLSRAVGNLAKSRAAPGSVPAAPPQNARHRRARLVRRPMLVQLRTTHPSEKPGVPNRQARAPHEINCRGGRARADPPALSDPAVCSRMLVLGRCDHVLQVVRHFLQYCPRRRFVDVHEDVRPLHRPCQNQPSACESQRRGEGRRDGGGAEGHDAAAAVAGVLGTHAWWCAPTLWGIWGIRCC